MANKRRFKFESIVISRPTVVAGRDVMPGEVLSIYDEDAEVTEDEVLALISRGAALEASKKNIAEVDKMAQAEKSVLNKKAEELARSEKKSHELATEAIKRADDLQLRVETLEEMLGELVASLAEQKSAEATKGE